MIGNDVIDIELARSESNWKRKGFLEKLFTEDEKCVILNAESPEITVWNLWSRKEAVYKIYNRETGIQGFIPLQIACSLDSGHHGTAACYGKTYFTQTEITPEFIHTVAVSEIGKILNIISIERCSVMKINGLPFSLENEKPISISHHGRFERIVAFA